MNDITAYRNNRFVFNTNMEVYKLSAKKRSHKKRTRDLWNTRRESQTQTKLDQPSRKNGQQQTSEIRPELQT